jgi:hypothetical protein
MQKTALVLALALFGLTGQAQAPDRPAASASPAPRPEARAEKPPPAKAPLPRGAVLEEVSGTVREVDRKVHRLDVDTPKGLVSLALDRNTMVYTAAGLGTMLDLAPGLQIRAGRNADFLAYWVQVLGPAKVSPPATPGQGTEPGGAAGPAAEPAGSGAGPPDAAPPGGAPPSR